MQLGWNESAGQIEIHRRVSEEQQGMKRRWGDNNG